MIKEKQLIKNAGNVCNIGKFKSIQYIAKEYKKICTAANIQSEIKYKTVQQTKRS